MTEEVSRKLIDRLAAAGYEPYDYSGRAMYGERCVAVDLPDSGQLFKLGMDVMRDADCELCDDTHVAENLYTDSMGRGIVAYWRYLPWPEGYCPPITHDRLMERLDEDLGEEGVRAAELSCLTHEDLQLGYDHCMERIRPALEEMM